MPALVSSQLCVLIRYSDARNKIRDEFSKHRDVQTKSEIEGVSIGEIMVYIIRL